MVIHCQEVWQEISNYLDEAIDPALKVALEDHIAFCSPCTAVVDGARNVIVLLGDERAFPVPAGLVERILARVHEEIR